MDQMEALANVRRDDIVHWDISPANSLTSSDVLTGVVDWRECARGTALSTSQLCCSIPTRTSKREQLWSAATARCAQTVVSAYLAHMSRAPGDFSIRHHSRMAVEKWLKSARSVRGRCIACRRTSRCTTPACEGANGRGCSSQPTAGASLPLRAPRGRVSCPRSACSRPALKSRRIDAHTWYARIRVGVPSSIDSRGPAIGTRCCSLS